MNNPPLESLAMMTITENADPLVSCILQKKKKILYVIERTENYSYGIFVFWYIPSRWIVFFVRSDWLLKP